MRVEQWYVASEQSDMEYCVNLGVQSDLSEEEEKVVLWLLTFVPGSCPKKETSLRGKVVEVGPRLNFETPFSSNAVSIFQGCGIGKIARCELSKRFVVPEGIDPALYASGLCDRMTEMVYEHPLTSFGMDALPARVALIPLLAEGREALARESKTMGYGWGEDDIHMIYDYFVNEEKRDPTNVELCQWAQANSEHSRHHLFKGRFVLDGVEMSESLLELIMHPLQMRRGKSKIAFADNSSAMEGCDVSHLTVGFGERLDQYRVEQIKLHALFTAETHNFPTGIAPFQGAETGVGGRIRDSEATGRGSTAIAGTAAYCVGHLRIPEYPLPWEKAAEYPLHLAKPIDIMSRASDGASDYGNKFGEPIIQGFAHSIEIALPNGERLAYLKPIMFTGGVGHIRDHHTVKKTADKGDVVVQIGGPAYRIGFGGGSASSQIQGANAVALDFNAVQRGDAEMEQRVRRVIASCVALGSENPILSIHDQGAGGPCNVLTELVHPHGGRIDIRKVRLGDKTLSVMEIWVAEYQERYGLLVRGDQDLFVLRSICERENVPCEVLGEVTGDGRITLFDEIDGSTPVNMRLERVLGKLPRKVFYDQSVQIDSPPFALPSGVTLGLALERVLRLPSVASKKHLTDKVDRSVGGRVARQQCCGSNQLPIADSAVVAFDFFAREGIATSIGERPLILLCDPKRGARMAMAEAVTNMMGVGGAKIEDMYASVNWMWAAKQPGEGVALYEAAMAISEYSIALGGLTPDGGKDSVSMATKVGDDIVKSPREVVISAYTTIPDIRQVVTPDIKCPGESWLLFVDLSQGRRMGGSALAYVYGQLGGEAPDAPHPTLLRCAFELTQELIKEGSILALHDRSDGGLITTVLEMAFAAGCGLSLSIEKKDCPQDLLRYLFNEECGFVLECRETFDIQRRFQMAGIPCVFIGRTELWERLNVVYDANVVHRGSMRHLRRAWEETSHRLRALQIDPSCASEEERGVRSKRRGVHYKFPATRTEQRQSLPLFSWKRSTTPTVGIVREEGTNGDRELAAAFHMAGFSVYDVLMSDLLLGRADIRRFNGVAFPGGFSYADAFGSARGWAAKILFHEKMRMMFDEFYRNPQTFSFGVCNGCQLMAQIGWVPGSGVSRESQPVFTPNRSRKFESRWSTVKILPSPSIFLRGMERFHLGVWVAHGEGRLHFPDPNVRQNIIGGNLAPMVYTDHRGRPTEKYPWNPNGSPEGIAALVSADGRHLAMMPHPERAFLLWQWPWVSKEHLGEHYAPWMRLFWNAYEWSRDILLLA